MKIIITTEFDIVTLSFKIHPVEWNVWLSGESDNSMKQMMPGYTFEKEYREDICPKDTLSLEIDVDSGTVLGWPKGLDAEVSLYDPEGVYCLEDRDGNAITYVGPPPKCLRLLDDSDMSFSIDNTGRIYGFNMDISLLQEWGITGTVSVD